MFSKYLPAVALAAVRPVFAITPVELLEANRYSEALPNPTGVSAAALKGELETPGNHACC